MGGQSLMDIGFMDSMLCQVVHWIEIFCRSNALLAETSLLFKWMGYVGVGLQVAAGLGFVIFVHELGHFLAAKTFGVKCEKFYVGFDVPISIGPIRLPRTLGRFFWGETEYGIGIIPLGGYVKMLGQDDDPRKQEEESERAKMDPRSYLSKPVWQRMIIISAGVVMNVIFAVVLAACAFLYGVPYAPTIIGSVPLGSPAWQAGLKPGDQVLQLAQMKNEDPYLRFEDLIGKTVVHGMKQPGASIPFKVERDGNRMTINVTPSNKLSPDGSLYLVGIGSASLASLSDGKPISATSYLASQNVDLKGGDRIVAIDGQALALHKSADAVLSDAMTDVFQAKWNKAIELTIMRKDEGNSQSEREIKVILPPVPTKTLGIGFAIGPITAIQSGSLAEKAGLNVGDIIESVNGQPVVDAMRLPMQVAENIGKPIEIKVSRGADEKTVTSNREQLTFTLVCNDPVNFGVIGTVSAEFGLANYGISYSVLPKVSSIDPGATKAVADVQIGDELTQMKLEPTESQKKELERPTLVEEEFSLSPRETIPAYVNLLQQFPVGMNIRCFFKRGEATREVVLPLAYAEDWYWILRGVKPAQLEKIQKTDQVGQAFQWGFGETQRRLGDVFEFLTVLVSGRASPRHLAGPFGIAEVAANEASSSPSRLLLFLTLLSANLAILNFLPIPALDGGHLMFLIAEAIRGKPLNEALQIRLTMVGVMCLLGLMAFAILNDILRKIL